MNIQYKEQLSCKATLVVLETRWYLSFEQQGPDTRYKKRPFQVSNMEWRNYCQALCNNFVLYEQKKAEGNEQMIQGEYGQWIRFGFQEGVCLFEKNLPVKKREKLESIVKEIEKAAQKADNMIAIRKKKENI